MRRRYHIYPSHYDLTLENNALFPQYYAFIDKELAFIQTGIEEVIGLNYSEKSKKKLITLLEPFLQKISSVIAYHEDGTEAFMLKLFREPNRIINKMEKKSDN